MFNKTITNAKSLTSTKHEVTIKVDDVPVSKIAKSIQKTYTVLAVVTVVTSIALHVIDDVSAAKAKSIN